MKGPRGFGSGGWGPNGPLDLGSIFDEIFNAARDFDFDEFQKKVKNFGENQRGGQGFFFDENTDYYPNYLYPPMNVFMTADRSLVFEFALAGFDEKDISLSFQGDYMVFSATIPRNTGNFAASGETAGEYSAPQENIRYFKRRLKMKDIEKQKYFVPLDKYAQEQVKAVFKNGILKVTIPPKEEPDQSDGIRIEIIREEN